MKFLGALFLRALVTISFFTIAWLAVAAHAKEKKAARKPVVRTANLAPSKESAKVNSGRTLSTPGVAEEMEEKPWLQAMKSNSGTVTGPQFETGLCTKANSGFAYYPHCQSLKQEMTKGCFGELTEKIRLAILADKVESTQALCPGHLRRAAASKEDFADLMVNLAASIATLESGWKPEDISGPSHGYMQIGEAAAKQPRYACGCSQFSGKDAVPLKDPAGNLKCGAYMAMYWIANSTIDTKDEVNSDAVAERDKMFLFKGESAPKLRPNNPPFGMTRAFGTFSDFQNEKHHKRDRILGKTKVYCDGKYGGRIETASGPGSLDEGTAPAER